MVTVPNLVGHALADAPGLLGRPLRLGRVSNREYSAAKQGTILSQSYAPGSRVPIGTTVDVVTAIAPRLVPVPNLVGHALADAPGLLGRPLHLGRVTNRESPNAVKGTILSQSYAPRSLVPFGTAVDVVTAIAPRLVPVPDLVGHAVQEAGQMLSPNLHLGEATRTETSEATEGVIVGQNPTPDTRVRVGSAVNVRVAVTPLVTVPKLVGHAVQDAGQMLSPKLRLGEVTRTESDEAEEGVIIGQDPSPDTRVRVGSGVNVQVAATPTVTVPDVVGKDLNEANTTLAGRRLRVGNVTERSAEGEPARVLTQDPLPGGKVNVGTAVDLVISKTTAPLVLIEPDNSNPASGKPVSFHAGLQPEFPGAEYQFFFGDGSATDWTSQPTATHTYSDGGSYPVHAVARIRGNEFSSGTIVLRVLLVSLVPSSISARRDETIRFTAAMKPATPGVEYNFVFDDGSETGWGRAATAEHAFRQTGAHHAQVSARIPSGQSVVSSPADIQVSIPPEPAPWRKLVAVLLAILAGASLAWHFVLKPKVVVGTSAGSQKVETPPPSDQGPEVRVRVVRPQGEQTVTFGGLPSPQEEASHD